jgi:hypothetical protein
MPAVWGWSQGIPLPANTMALLHSLCETAWAGDDYRLLGQGKA